VFVGFVMFMILGVALWLFPRPARGDERYRPALIELAYWLLLMGTIGRFAGEASQAWTDSVILGWIVVLGGLAQVVGIGVYFWTMWTRIRPAGSHLREAAGEKF
jgi:heme/copper-type cytochrome/quinol oxidase subunit 1